MHTRLLARAALFMAAAAIALAAHAGSAPESAAFGRVEVHFENQGLALAGSVLLPPGDRLPAAMLIHGSGASDRGNAWAMSVAESLAGCGIAVLIPDKRGSGQSQGDWQMADFSDLAADARAGWEVLRSRPEIDPRQVGFLGLSQGGHIAPLAAASTPGSAFAVSMVGSTRTMEEQLYDELEFAYRDHGLDQATIDYLQEFAGYSFDYIRSGNGWDRYLQRHREIGAGPLAPAVESWPASPGDPYWQFWRGIHDFDPMVWWRRVAAIGTRALIVFGANDRNVDVPASVARLHERLPEGGVTLRVYPGVGHSLQDPASGRLNSAIVAETCEWLAERTN